MQATDLDALLTLSLTPGLGPTLTRRCMELMGSAQAVLGASAARLAEVQGVGPASAATIRRGLDALGDGRELAREKELIAQHGVSLVALEDGDYPALLRHIPDPPPLLYVRGRITEGDALAIALVGARRCTAYGREQADRLAAFCAQAGLCVVSGGAYGIDAAAHRAALRLGGRTIAVLGSGLGDPYPADHIELFDQIASGAAGNPGGAVVSEFPMAAPPLAEHFPRRNRIISGLALGVVVVEASLRSGALITARLCSEEHNREVMAVPGRVDSCASSGCHRMIREGWARLVTTGAEVLEQLTDAGALLKTGLPREADAPATICELNLTENQKKVLACLDEARALDQIAGAAGLAIPLLQADLTVLQIRGLIVREDGQFRRRN